MATSDNDSDDDPQLGDILFENIDENSLTIHSELLDDLFTGQSRYY